MPAAVQGDLPDQPAKAVVPSRSWAPHTPHCGSDLSPCLCVSGLSPPPTPCSLGMSTTGEQGHHGPQSPVPAAPHSLRESPGLEQELHKQLLSEDRNRMRRDARLPGGKYQLAWRCLGHPAHQCTPSPSRMLSACPFPAPSPAEISAILPRQAAPAVPAPPAQARPSSRDNVQRATSVPSLSAPSPAQKA